MSEREFVRFCESRKVNESKPKGRIRTFVVSTEKLDSYDTIVEQSWNTERFDLNPIVLWNHDPDRPIARAIRWYPDVEQGYRALVADFEFMENDEFADKVLNWIDEGVVRGASVRFNPGDISWNEGLECLVLRDNYLVEMSVVSLPGNELTVKRQFDLVSEIQKERKVEEKEKEVTRSNQDAASAILNELNEARRTNATLKEENQRLTQAFQALSSSLVEQEVRSFVGKKIKETSFDKFLKIANSDIENFRSIMADMDDLPQESDASAPTVSSQSLLGKPKTATRSNGSAVVADMNERIRKTMVERNMTKAEAAMQVTREMFPQGFGTNGGVLWLWLLDLRVPFLPQNSKRMTRSLKVNWSCLIPPTTL